MKFKITLAFVFIMQLLSAQKIENLASLPPMGWNSWNTFEVHINEQLVKEMADKMVSSGMRDAGYTYLVLDDGWMKKDGRDSNGDLIPDPEKFPSGLQNLVDYVHSKGLKFGLYNSAGTQTCAGYPGTRGYEYQDARFYARHGVDFLKYDWCGTEGIQAKEAYTTMSKALAQTGRDIVFSVCEWGDNQPWEWAEPLGHMWRISGDIYPCFDCEHKHPTGWSSWGVLRILNMRENIRKYSGPDGWNDFDMLEVGNGMSAAQDRTHFTMWSMMSSPLFAGNDLRSMSAQTLSILTDRDIIALNQDPLGVQGFKWKTMGEVEIWVKPLAERNFAVAFLNRSTQKQKIEFNWSREIIKDPDFPYQLDLVQNTFRLRNLWKKRNEGTTKAKSVLELEPHDVVVYRLIPEK